MFRCKEFFLSWQRNTIQYRSHKKMHGISHRFFSKKSKIYVISIIHPLLSRTAFSSLRTHVADSICSFSQFVIVDPLENSHFYARDLLGINSTTSAVYRYMHWLGDTMNLISKGHLGHGLLRAKVIACRTGARGLGTEVRPKVPDTPLRPCAQIAPTPILNHPKTEPS